MSAQPKIDKELREKLIAVAHGDCVHNGIEFLEEGDWVGHGKYSYQETIVKHEDKYYCVQFSRSGSYFTDYDYGDPEVYEVKPVEVKRIEWRVVK